MRADAQADIENIITWHVGKNCFSIRQMIRQKEVTEMNIWLAVVVLFSGAVLLGSLSARGKATPGKPSSEQKQG